MPQIIDVEGIGQVEFPDDMSDSEIESTLRTHKDFQPKSFGQKAFDTAGSIAKGFNTGLGTFVKGAPVIGSMVDSSPQGPQVKEFEKNHPIASTGLKVAGGMAATAPLMMAAAPALGTGFAANAAGQGGMLAGLNTADTVARKGTNTSNNDLLWAIGTGLGGGLAGATLGKAITPNNITAPNIPKPPELLTPKIPTSEVPLNTMGVKLSDLPKGYQDALKNVKSNKHPTAAATEKQTIDVLNQGKLDQHKATVEQIIKDFEAKKQAARGGLMSDAVTGAGGAVAGHMLMGGPWGAPLGAAMAPYIRNKLPDMAGNYASNMVMANPANRAILMSIMNEIQDGKD